MTATPADPLGTGTAAALSCAGTKDATATVKAVAIAHDARGLGSRGA
ncbi:MAG: hypothetical protein WKF64_06910 [Ilumatobacteraceae bacterium]